MSVARSPFVRIQWSVLTVIPWYRQLLALVFGIGVMIISVYSIQQGSGAALITTVAGMAFMTLLLIFGIEVDQIEIGDKVVIDFSDTTVPPKDKETKTEDNDDDLKQIRFNE